MSNYKIRTQNEIMKHWGKNSKEIVLSVSCLTYNHENFIHDAIQGFLSQETDFAFEIIIRDDSSTDNTVAILKKYVQKYPKLIKLLLMEKNTLSKGHRGISDVLKIATGKYIAICDGDDHWTDKFKLQKQVDFLEKNPEYVLCFSDFSYKNLKAVFHFKNDYSRLDLLKGASLPTSAVCFRNKKILNNIIFYKGGIGDLLIWSMLGLYGKAKLLKNIKPTFYRIHSNNMWVNKPKLYILETLASTFKNLSKIHFKNFTFFGMLSLYFFIKSIYLSLKLYFLKT